MLNTIPATIPGFGPDYTKIAPTQSAQTPNYGATVEQQYQDLFGRAPKQEGLDYWSGQLSSGALEPGNLQRYMLGAASPGDLALHEGLSVAPATPEAPDWRSRPRTPPGLTGSMSPAFDFPLDLYQSSSSYSGLPSQYQEQILSGIIPQLLQSVQNMPGNIDQYTQDAMNAYGSSFKNQATKIMPSVLNEIFGRNMQESSIAGDVTSKAMSDITAGLQPQAYQTAMQGALLKSQMPSLLADIAGLGSSTQMESSDPGQPYSTALAFLQNMMQ